jgi:beta-phosphoglucomutase
MKYKYYLFDLDGVIVNTDEIQYNSTKDAVFEFINYDISKDYEVSDVFRTTITTLEKLNFLKSRVPLIEQYISDIYKRKKQLADYNFSKFKDDYEKIEMMSYLKNNKCKIAIVTNSNKQSALKILKSIGVIDFIDVIVSNEDVLNAKPNPEPYLNAIEILSAKKEECIIFEDSEVGLISARQSGCDFYNVKSHSSVNIELINKINLQTANNAHKD